MISFEAKSDSKIFMNCTAVAKFYVAVQMEEKSSAGNVEHGLKTKFRVKLTS